VRVRRSNVDAANVPSTGFHRADGSVEGSISLATLVTSFRVALIANSITSLAVSGCIELPAKFVTVVTDFDLTTNYFWDMDPSVHYLMGDDAPVPEGATIHSIAPPPPISSDDDKIGFTLDVTMRLDQEQADDAQSGVIVPIAEGEPQQLADSA